MKSDELIKVKKAFVKWREQKKHGHEKIPDELWQKVIVLQRSHSKYKLAKFLNISPSIFHSKGRNSEKSLHKIIPTKKIKKSREPFIQIPSTIPSVEKPECTFEMILPNGSKIRIFS